MSRLIDADALQNILLPITTALEHECGSLGGAVSGCMKHIDNAPTVDAEAVVRCSDCQHSHLDGWLCGGYGMMTEHHTFPHEYCSHGERRHD